jgi:DNA-directed RNA polymerase subunit RPC12/RpoP
MASWLRENGFDIERQLTVSHFRMGWAKRHLPLRLLVGMDALLQPTGALWQYTPSVFLRARASSESKRAASDAFFKCPECKAPLPLEIGYQIACPNCGRRWGIKNGIYNFKEALKT